MDVMEFILLSRIEEHTHMGVGGLVYPLSPERMKEHTRWVLRDWFSFSH